jgi:hypothetical protein
VQIDFVSFQIFLVKKQQFPQKKDPRLGHQGSFVIPQIPSIFFSELIDGLEVPHGRRH